MKGSSAIDYTSLSGMLASRPHSMLVALLFVGLTVMGIDKGETFLFPDMALHGLLRSGGHSRYVIAALEEEPYLHGNSSGLLVELLRGVASSYSRMTDSSLSFDYEIEPVKTWEELMTRANSDHVQLAFGLICPYLLKTDFKFSGIHSSIAVVHTSVKFITGSAHSPRLSNHMPTKLWDLPNLVNVKGSPEDRLLEWRRSQRSRGHGQAVRYHEVDSLGSALEHIRRHDNAYVVTDAIVADNVVAHEHHKGLRAVCPSKKLSHSGHLFYGFFGKNDSLLKFINHLLKALERDGKLDDLLAKYLKVVRHCV